MLLAVTFAINSALNFVLGLLIAQFLGPEQFGLYALGAALLVLINAFGIDWLKLSTIRFYSKDKRVIEPSIRATLDGMAALCTLGLIVILFTAIIAGVDLKIPTAIVAGAVAAGVIGGLFDYQQAVARARAEDVVYARMVIIKNVMALVLMVGGAWLTKDPALVLVGSALSSLAALISVRRALADAPLMLKSIDRSQLRIFAIYALPLVATNVLLSTIPLLNRSVMSTSHGLAEAGYFALASDIGVKLMGTLGATLEIMLLPLAVRAFDRDGLAAAHARIRQNLVIVLAIILPVGAGWLLVMPAFEALVVPPAFRGHFSLYMWVLMPAFVTMSLMQVGFNPVNLIAQKTVMSTVAAAAAVSINGALLFVLPLTTMGMALGPTGIAAAMSAGFVAAALIIACGAMRHELVRPSLGSLGLIVLGLVLMTVCLLPLRAMQPAALALCLQLIVGAIVYGGTMIAGNLGGCRQHLMAYLRTRKLKAAP
ncbi:MAG: lipopolysaccharide biosynthesis protein [Bosea sp. (in: a-proteobacteria)]